MILQAGYDCWLTQAADVPMSERRFENQVIVDSAEDVELWKEITGRQKDEMQAAVMFIDVNDITYEALERVDRLRGDISTHINAAPLTANESLAMKWYYPAWEDMIGALLNVEFRFRYGETLYEVIMVHTVQAEWIPGQGTESLYKVVQVEHEGTMEDPIPWEQGMELFAGKYYTDKEVLYLCVRDSGMGMAFDLADLVSGGFVEVVEAETDIPSEGVL